MEEKGSSWVLRSLTVGMSLKFNGEIAKVLYKKTPAKIGGMPG